MSFFLKFAAFFALAGFFISLFFGLLSGNSSLSLFITAFTCSILSVVGGVALYYLLKRQIPELLELVLQGRKVFSQQPYSKDAEESEEKPGEKLGRAGRNRDDRGIEDDEIDRDDGGIGKETARKAEIEKSNREGSYGGDLHTGRQLTEPDLNMGNGEIQTVELRREAHKPPLADTIQIKNEPKLMAEAIRTMILKDE